MRKRLGEILVTAGVIDELQLRSALAEAARWGKRVGEVLVARRHCTDQEILDALASQLGVAVAPLSTTMSIAPGVLRLLPPNYARDKQVLPLLLDGRTGALEMAVSDPAAYELLDELRFRTGHEIRPVVATPTEIAVAIEHFYFGAPRQGRPIQAFAPPGIEVPSFTPSPDDSIFDHAAPGSPSESRDGPPLELDTVRPPPVRPVKLEASPRREPPAAARPAATDPSTQSAELTDASLEIIRLEAENATLRSRVDRAFEILREAAIAHRTLLQDLSEKGIIDRVEHSRRVQERLRKGK